MLVLSERHGEVGIEEEADKTSTDRDEQSDSGWTHDGWGNFTPENISDLLDGCEENDFHENVQKFQSSHHHASLDEHVSGSNSSSFWDSFH